MLPWARVVGSGGFGTGGARVAGALIGFTAGPSIAHSWGNPAIRTAGRESGIQYNPASRKPGSARACNARAGRRQGKFGTGCQKPKRLGSGKANAARARI